MNTSTNALFTVSFGGHIDCFTGKKRRAHSRPKIRRQHQSGPGAEPHFFPLDVFYGHRLVQEGGRQKVTSYGPQAVMQEPIDTDIGSGWHTDL